MTFAALLLSIFLSSLYLDSSYASCAGVKGCNPCYDSLRGTTLEDVKCETDSECVAIPHRCGDFYALNRSRSEKYTDGKLKLDPAKKAPKLECKFHSGWNAKVCSPAPIIAP